MGSTEGEENRPQDRPLRDTTAEFDRIGLRVVDRHRRDRTLRDTTAEFDRIGLRVVDRHRLDAVVQIRLGSDEGGIVVSKCVL